MERYKIMPPRPRCEDCSPLSDRRTMDVHVQMICGRLAADLNILLDGYPAFHGMEAQQIYRHTAALPRLLRNEVRFAAGGIVCHEYYFRYLTEGGEEHLPDAVSAKALHSSFGSADSFFYIFREEAQRMQTAGFLWLCEENRARIRRLRLVPTHGYELLPPSLSPVLALDLWEHAYIGNYGGNRRQYADAFLRQLDWEAVGRAVTGDGARP